MPSYRVIAFREMAADFDRAADEALHVGDPQQANKYREHAASLRAKAAVLEAEQKNQDAGAGVAQGAFENS